MPTYGVERKEREGLNMHTGMAAVEPCFWFYGLHFFHPPYSCKARLFASLSGKGILETWVFFSFFFFFLYQSCILNVDEVL